MCKSEQDQSIDRTCELLTHRKPVSLQENSSSPRSWLPRSTVKASCPSDPLNDRHGKLQELTVLNPAVALAGTLGHTCNVSMSHDRAPGNIDVLGNSSSSLRDIQFRAASSTKCRRRTQMLPENPFNPVDPIRPRKSQGNFRSFDVARPKKILPANAVKRCAIYTRSMYLDSPLSDATVSGDGDGENSEFSISSSTSWSSAVSQAENAVLYRHSHCQSDTKGDATRVATGRRLALAAIDINIHAKSESPLAPLNPPSLPIHLPFADLSNDSIQSSESKLHRRPDLHQPIVLELLTALDIAISEWDTDYT